MTGTFPRAIQMDEVVAGQLLAITLRDGTRIACRSLDTGHTPQHTLTGQRLQVRRVATSDGESPRLSIDEVDVVSIIAGDAGGFADYDFDLVPAQLAVFGDRMAADLEVSQ